MHKSFPFWPFLHCRFSLSPHFARQSNGWVKIYNVKKVKTEMTCAPPKTCQNQKSFWIPSNQPPNTCRSGWANFFHKKHVFVKHPNVHCILYIGCFARQGFLLFLETSVLAAIAALNVDVEDNGVNVWVGACLTAGKWCWHCFCYRQQLPRSLGGVDMNIGRAIVYQNWLKVKNTKHLVC